MPSNQQTILQIVEERATKLVAEHSVPFAHYCSENLNSTAGSLDSFEHIARVQALLIYQVLCLYDGDIRLRHIAETHISVLYGWMEQMVEQASSAVCLGSSIVSFAREQLPSNPVCLIVITRISFGTPGYWLKAFDARGLSPLVFKEHFL